MARNPQAYLRLNRFMNLALAEGSIPEESELRFRGNKLIDTAPVVRVTNHKSLKESRDGPDHYTLTNQCNADEQTSCFLKEDHVDQRTDVDFLGDRAADLAFPQDWTAEMLLMDPELVLQNLLDSYTIPG
jgi:hypothetical protein